MFKAEQARREKQATTKERLMREQALRRGRELATGKKDRPLSKLAATEAKLKARRAAPATQAPAQPAAPAGSSRLSKVGGALKVGGGFLAGRLWGATKEATRKDVEPNKLTGWIFFVLSLILYYFVDWGTGYNGIDFGFFTNLGGADWLLKSGFLTIAVIIAVAQFIFAKPKSAEEFRSNLSLSVVLAFVFIISKYSIGALFHALFLLGMWFVLLRPVKSTINANKILMTLIFIDFLGFSALKYLLANTGFLGGAEIVANYLVFPIFALYILGYLKAYGKSGLAAWLLFFIIVLYIFGFVSTSVQYQTLTAEIDEKQREEAWGFWQTSVFRLTEFAGIVFDPISCSTLAGTGDYDLCLQDRQYDRLCAEKGRGTEEYDACIKQKQGLGVEGEIDTERKEFTEVILKKPSNFPKQIQALAKPGIPMQLEIKSPISPITIELSCKLKTSGESEIEGKIQPAAKIEEITGTKTEIIKCEMPADKEYKEGKRYTVTFNAKIDGIESESDLTRLFIGEELKEPEKTSLMALHKLKIADSSDSAKEFAVFAIGVGTPPDYPLINDNLIQSLSGDVENKGKGKITAIENIEVNLIDGVTPRENCLSAFDQTGNNLILKQEIKEQYSNIQLKQKGEISLLNCDVDISPNLAQTKDYVTRGFYSKIIYAYEIEEKGSFTVARSFTST